MKPLRVLPRAFSSAGLIVALTVAHSSVALAKMEGGAIHMTHVHAPLFLLTVFCAQRDRIILFPKDVVNQRLTSRGSS